MCVPVGILEHAIFDNIDLLCVLKVITIKMLKSLAKAISEEEKLGGQFVKDTFCNLKVVILASTSDCVHS